MFNIAIDGYMGCGKTSLMLGLAKKLKDFKILNTGAIFRGYAYGYDKLGLGDVTDGTIETLLKNVSVEVVFIGDDQHVLVNGEDVTAFLRTERISQLASIISAYKDVREKYMDVAKGFAKNNNCIMEGRDIGTNVLKHADVKIFLTADEKIRAERRLKQLKEKGEKVSLKQVIKDMNERDSRDSNREIAPLKPADDSIIVDNSDMNLEETIEFCFDLIQKVMNKNKVINVTIDGYVCSGKSTIAKSLAKRIGFKVFDTGAVYRGIACAYVDMGCDEGNVKDEKYVKNFADQIDVKIDFIDGVEHVYVNGIDHTANLRTEHISFLSSQIACFSFIREKVLKLQRNFAKSNNIVMEGRDIGSVVLPDAEFKFFCTADDNVRAKRRFEQQKLLGNDVSFEEILKELKQRDYSDVHRDHGAIVITPTSIILDTTNMTLDESVEFCIKEISKKYPQFKNC